MVDLHGSQCGFCTPGIVMSLFAHYHAGARRDARRASTTRWPAISAAAPAIGRSSMRRSVDLRRRRRRPLRRDGGGAARRARGARRRHATSSSATKRLLRRAGERGLARRALSRASRRDAARRRDRRRPLDHQAVACDLHEDHLARPRRRARRDRETARRTLSLRRRRHRSPTRRRISPRSIPTSAS